MQTPDLYFQSLLSSSPTLFLELATAFSDLNDIMTLVVVAVAAASVVALIIQYLSCRQTRLVSTTYHPHTPPSLKT